MSTTTSSSFLVKQRKTAADVFEGQGSVLEQVELIRTCNGQFQKATTRDEIFKHAYNQRRLIFIQSKTVVRSEYQNVFIVTQFKHDQELGQGGEPLSSAEVSRRFGRGLIDIEGLDDATDVSETYVGMCVAVRPMFNNPTIRSLVLLMEKKYTTNAPTNNIINLYNIGGKNKSDEEIIWTLRTIEDWLDAGLCAPTEFSCRHFRGEGSKKSIVLLFQLKLQCLKYFTSEFLDSFKKLPSEVKKGDS